MSFGFFVKKTERLTTAIYMITDFIGDKEPMRWKLREESMNLLSLMGNMGASDITTRWNVFYQVLRSMARIESLIEMSQMTKLISEMNASVVLKEYRELKSQLRTSWSTLTESGEAKIPEGFFKIDKAPEIEVPAFVSPISKPLPKTDTLAPRANMSDRISMGQKAETKIATPKENVPYHAPKILKDNHNDRRKTILDMLKEKREVSVGDIKAGVPGVSDKTIQRELIAMVESGLLIRKGDRRWSTYSLPISVSQNVSSPSTPQ